MLPHAARSDERTLLVLKGESDSQAGVEERFSTELELVLEEIRVAGLSDGGSGFSALSKEGKLDAANSMLKQQGALCLVWLECVGESVHTVGLLVSAEGGTLARTVAFENSIAFMPELAIIVSELIEHALTYEAEERKRRSAAGEGAPGESGSTEAGTEAAATGLGRRIPAPDGWTRLMSDNGVAREIAPAGEGASTDAESEAVEEEQSGDVDASVQETSGKEQADGEESDAGGEAEVDETDQTADQKEETGKARPATPRRLSLEPLFELASGIGPHEGSALWIGGGGAISFWPLPAIFVELSLVAHAGPLPRYDADNLFGWRLFPAITAGYLFKLSNTRLGPMLQAAGAYTNITVEEQGYVPQNPTWGGFRAALGGSFIAPVDGRISFSLSALFCVFGTKGREFVRLDDGEVIFQSALGEFTARMGILIFL